MARTGVCTASRAPKTLQFRDVLLLTFRCFFAHDGCARKLPPILDWCWLLTAAGRRGARLCNLVARAVVHPECT